MHLVPFIQFLLIPLLSLNFLAFEGIAQVAIIANKSVPVETITNTELYDLYAFETRKWQDGQPVIVFDLKPHEEVRIDFFKFLGKSPSRMKSIWLVNKLSGEGEPPEALSSEEVMLQRVAETPGAIGFVCLPFGSDLVKVLAVIKERS